MKPGSALRMKNEDTARDDQERADASEIETALKSEHSAKDQDRKYELHRLNHETLDTMNTKSLDRTRILSTHD